MFREMRRKKQQTEEAVCREILRTEKRGVLSVQGDDGYPYGVPVNFSYDEGENTIYIHGAKQGHKIDAIRRCDKVSFTTWGRERQDEGDWFYHLTGVVAFGRAELVEDRERTESAVRALGLKYYPSAELVEAEIRSAIDHVQLIAIHIEHMTGKEITEK